MIEIKLSEQLLRVESVHAAMKDLDCGATNVFIGTVRAFNGPRKVLQLEFEAKESMAHKELHAIAEEATQKWPAKQILIHHRTGVVELGDIPVIVAVSTPHRAAAFAACQYIIDELKKRVPIWKKERYSDGEIWVSAHP
jgi:molybdopterin synthase catalytic subunit